LTRFGFLDDLVRIKKPVFLRNRVFVPTNDLLAFGTQGQREAELGSNTIAVRADVTHNAESPAIADAVYDAVDDFGMGLHQLKL
jgi:hypothetical protein